MKLTKRQTSEKAAKYLLPKLLRLWSEWSSYPLVEHISSEVSLLTTHSRIGEPSRAEVIFLLVIPPITEAKTATIKIYLEEAEYPSWTILKATFELGEERLSASNIEFTESGFLEAAISKQ